MKDKLSTLLDGSLDEESMAAMFDLLKRDPSARREWDTWCLIGDVLRGEQGGSPDFVARVMDAVEREPVVFAPARAAASEARRSVWRAMLPVAASVMGVAAVGWVAHTISSQERGGVELATSPAAVVEQQVSVAGVRGQARTVAVDPHREYVFAHQAMSGGPLPGAVQYVRTVSELQPESGR
jgi:sigma-E factor negative regulatory protein RseA